MLAAGAGEGSPTAELEGVTGIGAGKVVGLGIGVVAGVAVGFKSALLAIAVAGVLGITGGVNGVAGAGGVTLCCEVGEG